MAARDHAFALLRFMARVTAAVTATWATDRFAHPALALAVGLASLFWIANAYDNHTGSIVLVTALVVSALAILIVLLVAIAAMAAR